MFKGIQSNSVYIFELDGHAYEAAKAFVDAVRGTNKELKDYVESTGYWNRIIQQGKKGSRHQHLAEHLLKKKFHEGPRNAFQYYIRDRYVDDHVVKLQVKLPEKYAGKSRNAISVPRPTVLHTRKGIDEPFPPEVTPVDPQPNREREEERKKIADVDDLLGRSGIEGKVREATIKARVNQGVFRERLLEKYDGQCCITGIRNEELLIASHIKPWSESKDDERLIPENGLLLNALHDKAFDRGLITLTDDYRLKVNKKLSSSENKVIRETLLIDEGKPINWPTSFRPEKKYLQWHRRKHGFEK